MTDRASSAWERYQEILPVGLTIEHPLFGSQNGSRVFLALDRRVDAARPIRRVVRILEGGGDPNNWRGIQQRATELLRHQFAHVSVLRELGTQQERLYLVHDEHPYSLGSQLHPGEKWSAATVLAIAEPLLLALVELHRHAIAHGDVRPESVFVSQELSAAKPFDGNVWLADAALGNLGWWSNGKLLSNGSKKYFPPEWKGTPREPSFKADLYALGVLLKRLHNGLPSGNSKVLSSRSRLENARWRRRFGSEGALQYLLSHLLADEAERPADASSAMQRFRMHNKKAARRKSAAIVVLGLMLIFALWHGAREGGHSDGVIELQGKLQQSSALLDAAQRKVQEKDADIAALQKRLSEVDPSPHHLKGQWKSILEAQENFTVVLDSLRNESAKLSPADQQVFNGWIKRFRDLKERDHLAIWFEWAKSRDGGLLSKLRKTTADPAKMDELQSELERWNEAAKLWNAWAHDDEIRIDKGNGRDDLNGKIASRSEPIKVILNEWMDAIEKNDNWKLRLLSGVAPAGHGTRRVIWVREEMDDHMWVDEIEGDYRQMPCEIVFDWKPGDPISVALSNGASAWKLGLGWSMLIDQSVGGPLALWRLHQAGKVELDGFVLKFEIENCPGPPRELPLSINTQLGDE